MLARAPFRSPADRTSPPEVSTCVQCCDVHSVSVVLSVLSSIVMSILSSVVVCLVQHCDVHSVQRYDVCPVQCCDVHLI